MNSSTDTKNNKLQEWTQQIGQTKVHLGRYIVVQLLQLLAQWHKLTTASTTDDGDSTSSTKSASKLSSFVW